MSLGISTMDLIELDDESKRMLDDPSSLSDAEMKLCGARLAKQFNTPYTIETIKLSTGPLLKALISTSSDFYPQIVGEEDSPRIDLISTVNEKVIGTLNTPMMTMMILRAIAAMHNHAKETDNTPDGMRKHINEVNKHNRDWTKK